MRREGERDAAARRKLDRTIHRLRRLRERPPSGRHFSRAVRHLQRLFRSTFPDGATARRHLVQFWETDTVAWQPAARTLTWNGQPVRLGVTPAWKILKPFPPDGDGGSTAVPRLGISPAHDDSRHLVNGWLAEVEGEGLAPLRLVRHGHLRDWPRIRSSFGQSPAPGELLALAARCQARIWNDLRARVAAGTTDPVPLRLASIQLMTPGARPWFCDGERPEEQARAWAMAERKGVAVAIGSHPAESAGQIFLIPEVLAFNFPVNPWYHRLGGVRLMGKLPIPEDFFPANDRSLETLLGNSCAGGEEGPHFWKIPPALEENWRRVRTGTEMEEDVLAAALGLWDSNSLVGAALRGGERSERERWQIIQLARQVLELCQVTAEKRGGLLWKRRALRGYEDFCHVRNPYAMPARVLVLCHLLGLPCACNCRSGKDRTGIFHGEVAYLWLVLQGDRRGTVPEPCLAEEGPPLREMLERARVLDACGSDHILFSCTGFHGYRVQDDRRWLRALLRFPFLDNLHGPLAGTSWLAES
jgi:hypothetical protein